jgi:hypothetical protein
MYAQEPSLKIVPENPSKSATVKDTAGSLGLHDPMQYGLRSLASEIKTDDGYRSRLELVSVFDIVGLFASLWTSC